jgi:hypothetical protein
MLSRAGARLEGDLVLSLKGRHPDDFRAGPPGRLDCPGVDAAHRAIEHDRTDHPNAWHLLLDQRRSQRGAQEVVLEHHRRHPALARLARHFVVVQLAWNQVGRAVDVGVHSSLH